jgi:hypothetical protein
MHEKLLNKTELPCDAVTHLSSGLPGWPELSGDAPIAEVAGSDIVT